jgi:hypothetical protein
LIPSIPIWLERRGELNAAQAVVIEKQGVVDSVIATRGEARIAYNSSIDTLIAALVDLKVVVE